MARKTGDGKGLERVDMLHGGVGGYVVPGVRHGAWAQGGYHADLLGILDASSRRRVRNGGVVCLAWVAVETKVKVEVGGPHDCKTDAVL